MASELTELPLLLDRVRELGARIPDATAIAFVDERGRVKESISRAEVVTEVGEVVDFLRQRCGLAPGDRALLVYPPGLDFVRGLVGCIAAGVLPVPIYPPDPINPQRSIESFQRMVADCGAKAVLTSRRYAGARRLGTAKSLVTGSAVDWPGDLPWYVTSRAIGGRRTRGLGSFPKAASDWAPSLDTPAFLQYTSGSTSNPKGVVITHANLAHQIDFNRRLLGLGLDSRAVVWVPPYHDFGLISSILSALAGNAELTMMSPLSFIQRPALWFEVMDRVRATHTAAPNFAYELAVRKTTAEQRAQWDLSSLKVMMSAAEPVREDTTRRFLEAFAVAGLRPEAFCPAYGLAEHTVGVTMCGHSTLRVDRHQLETQRRAVAADGPDCQALMGCGELADDVDVRIVDPELCVPLGEGQVGEIWVDSPSKAAGYWGSPEQSRAIFEARLAGVDGSEGGRGYLRTGDLGFLRDGELYVCGRVKDLLILAGRNIYPQDIEDSLRDCHEAIRPGGTAAFAIDSGNIEALAVLVEVRADASPEVLASVVDAVRAVVLTNHQLRCSVVVLGRPGSVSKTTSGKVQRSRCRARLLDGSLEAEALLVERLADEEPIGAAPTQAPQEDKEGAPGISAAPIAGSDADELQPIVRAQVAAVLGIRLANVDIDHPLGAQGLNSVGVVELASRLSQVLGRDVQPLDVFNYPTVEGLAKMLSHGAQSSVASDRAARTTDADEPIAVVAMACRAPGGVSSPEGYWGLLGAGRDAIGPFPDRWDADAIYDADPEAVGKTYSRAGGFVRDVDLFDAGFFGISPREAMSMDPQQRLVLEVVWEAFERAGLPAEALNESLTGVYLGCSGSDYGGGASSLEALDGYQLTGQTGSVVSGRVSYVLGLQGPAMTVDTACSSSLVAVHLAVSALRQGECDLALAGGVQVMSTPGAVVEFSRLQASSADGRCKAFSAEADGAGWSEGCGILVLKRLSDARRDGDRVLALVRGSAVNQDGRSQGLTAPNGPSQQRVIRAALRVSGLVPDDIDAVEAHGTGTALGDPIEAGALAEVFGPTRRAERPLWLGSSKSNIGHSIAAAGVLGVVKMVLAFEHECLPATLHAHRPSEHIAWEASGLALLQESRPWLREAARVRRAGVSSFGISGTNAHVVLEEAPDVVGPPAAQAVGDAPIPLLISARDEAALRAQAGRWAAWLQAHPQTAWPDVLATAALHRTHFDVRAALAVAGLGAAVDALSALAEGRAHPGVGLGQARSRGKVVFVFPGHGSQWVGMGRALLADSAVFAQAVAACDAALAPHTGWSVTAVLRGDAGDTVAALDRVDVVQPALFAMGVGLAAVWRSLGVQPHAVLGHSVGEIAAAVVAGALSLHDGAHLVALRARLIAALPHQGAMLSVGLPASVLAEFLLPWADLLSVGVVNAADSSVASGDAEAIAELDQILQAEGVFCRRVAIGFAAHSSQMDEVLEELRDALGELRPVAGGLPFYSSVTGGLMDGAELDSAYWCRNVRDTVRFDTAVQALLDDGYGVFVEQGGHPALAVPLNTACAQRDGVVTGSLQSDAGGLAPIYHSLGRLHTLGHPIDWATLHTPTPRLAPLPTYPFQRDRYWLEVNTGSAEGTSAVLSCCEHPLLGASTELADGAGFLFAGRLSRSEPAWLADHVVFDRVVLPGTGLIELVTSAARAAGGGSVGELVIHTPVIAPERGALQFQIRLDAPDGRGWRSLGFYSRADADGGDMPWTRHASGLVGAFDEAVEPPAPFEARPPAGAQTIDLSNLHARMASRGLHLGPSFRGLARAWKKGAWLYGHVVLPGDEADGAGDYGVHPALLDAALQLCFSNPDFDRLGFNESTLFLPFAWSDVCVHAVGANELWVRLEILDSSSEAEVGLSLTAWDGAGLAVISIGQLRFRRTLAEQLRAVTRSSKRDLYGVDWQALRFPEPPRQGEGWIVLGGDGRLADSLGVATVTDTATLSVALDSGASVPERLIFDMTSASPVAGNQVAASVHRSSATLLSELQAVLAEPRLSSTAVVCLTCSAVSSEPGDRLEDLAHAPLWGLVRSARNEHPERVLRLVDLDGLEQDVAQLRALLSVDGEPELALRAGRALAPRLLALPDSDDLRPSGKTLWPEGTVLITGGLGGLGQAMARHLVAKHGQRHLLLTSRQGMEVSGAAEFIASLQAMGASSVEVAACDVADRDALAELLSSIPEDRPLRAVFHLAGVLDDGMLGHLTPERLSRVLRPKVDGALHLHELTQGMDLSAFVLFSSVSGVMGGPGQANYAAANSFLDALAGWRRSRGLPALSLAWGLWEQQDLGMAAHLSNTELLSMRRQGLAPMSTEVGLALLDAALERPEAVLVPVRLDLERIQRNLADAGATTPAILRALLRPALRRVRPTGAEASALRKQLSVLPEAERLDALVLLVRQEVAAVLGAPGLDAVPADRPLNGIGFDSLMAVELQHRLSSHAGTTLPATLAFDHPTPAAIAQLLLRQAFAELDTVGLPATTPAAVVTTEPIAVVAMACRAPGGVSSPEGYWGLLGAGRDAIGPFPDRWDADAIYDADPEAVGKTYSRAGGFVRDVDLFDAGFFGISPREAMSMDPQQRLVLEVVWEAFERAGLPAEALNESLTGVYLGCSGSDYGGGASSLEALDGYQLTGQTGSVVSGRVSYVLGLQGPAMTVDTACSSSLVAVHLAVSALRQGECDLALAGGVQVMSTPGAVVEFSRLQASSADGRCKAFSAEADGAGWSEGCGILVLKRLSDARRDGDRVLALVRGSAVNQDGRSQGLTAPNGPSQQRVIRAALRVSGLVPDDIDAVEAHGTGTALGDPIEAGALAEVFGPTRRAERPLWLGSSKSNIGHSIAAAGVLGVVKMVLAFEHECLPATLHAHRPSEHIAWEASGLALLQESRPWLREAARVRRAGVSSFGISGTNAHVVLEEAPDVVGPPAAQAVGDAPIPLLISARDEAALRAQAGRWAAWLQAHPQTAWPDVLATAALHRTHFDVRAALAVAGLGAAVDALSALAEGRAHPGVGLGQARSRGKVVFVFPGHGSQWVGMGRALLADSAVFAQAVAACDAALAPHTGWSVTAVLRGDAGDTVAALDRVDVVQPALFAMGVGLAAVWRSLGVQPHAVLGHSVGEIAAAVVAGALSLHDGAHLVALRARLIAALPHQGAMLSVGLPASVLAQRLKPWSPTLSVGVVNAADSSVASGDAEAIAELDQILQAEGVFCRRVAIGFAAHSSQMDEVLEELRDALGELRPVAGGLPFYSSVTGGLMDGAELDSAYWCRNVRDTVRFDTAVQALLDDGYGVFVEQGGHPALAVPLNTACAQRDGVVTGSLQSDAGGLAPIYHSLGRLHTLGHPIDWATLHTPTPRLAPLPTYPFQRDRYWLEPAEPQRPVSGAADSELWDAVRSGDPDTVAGLLDLPDTVRTGLAPLLPHLAAWRSRQDAEASRIREAREALLGVKAPPPTVDASALRAQLSALSDRERLDALVRLVRQEAAAVLGMAGPEAVPAGLSFKEQGFDSLMAVELRNRLSARVEATLPSAVAIEYPTPEAVAGLLLRHAFAELTPTAALAEPAPTDVGSTTARRAPATLNQQRLWFLHETLEDPSANNVHLCIELDRTPDVLALQQALDWVVDRHDSLQTSFRTQEDGLWQHIDPTARVRLRRLVLPSPQGAMAPIEPPRSSSLNPEQATALSILSRSDASLAFSLDESPLVRVGFVPLPNGCSALLVTLHRCIVDESSLPVFCSELDHGYRAYRCANESDAVLLLPRAAAVFEEEQRWLASEDASRHRDFWRKYLHQVEALDLPGQPASPHSAVPGEVHRFELDESLGDAVQRLAQGSATEPFTVFLYAFAAVLGRDAGRDSVLVGSVQPDRGGAGGTQTIGSFAKMLPLRVDVAGDEFAHDALTGLAAELADVFAYARLDYSEILGAAGFDASMKPVRAALIMQDSTWVPKTLLDSSVTVHGASLDEHPAWLAGVDVSLVMTHTKHGFGGRFEYRVALQSAKQIEGIARHFEQLLRQLVARPEARLSELMPPSEFAPAAPLDDGHGKDDYVAPRYETEGALVSLWSEVLGIDAIAIGVHDDFFAMGGNSIRTVSLVGLAAHRYGLKICPRDVVSHPTIADLARAVSMPTAAQKSTVVQLAVGDSPGTVLLLNGVGGTLWGLAGFAEALAMDRAVYGLQTPPIAGTGPMPATLSGLVAHYLADLPSPADLGPVVLVGYSWGGTVALALSKILDARGYDLRGVALLDTMPPDHPRLNDIRLDEYVALMGIMTDLWVMPPEALKGADQVTALRIFRTALDAASQGGRSSSQAMARAFLESVEVGARAAADWTTPDAADVPVSLFIPEHDSVQQLDPDDDYGWSRYVFIESVVGLRGDHWQLLRSPHLSANATAVAQTLKTWLAFQKVRITT